MYWANLLTFLVKLVAIYLIGIVSGYMNYHDLICYTIYCYTSLNHKWVMQMFEQSEYFFHVYK